MAAAAAAEKENEGAAAGAVAAGGKAEEGGTPPRAASPLGALAGNSPNVTPRTKERRRSLARRVSASPASDAVRSPATGSAPGSAARPGAALRVGLRGVTETSAAVATPRSRLGVSVSGGPGGPGPAPEIFAATRRLATALGGGSGSPWDSPTRKGSQAAGSPVRVRVRPVGSSPVIAAALPSVLSTAVPAVASPADRVLGRAPSGVASPGVGSPVRVRVRTPAAAESPAALPAQGSAESLLQAAETAAAGAGAGGMSPLVGALTALGAAASAVSRVRPGATAEDKSLESLQGRVEAIRRRLKHRTTVAFHEATVGGGPGTPGRLKTMLRQLSAEPELLASGVSPTSQVATPLPTPATVQEQETSNLAVAMSATPSPAAGTPGSTGFEFGFAAAPTPPTPVMMPSPATPAVAAKVGAGRTPQPTALANVLAQALQSAANEAAAAERGLQAAHAATPSRVKTEREDAAVAPVEAILEDDAGDTVFAEDEGDQVFDTPPTVARAEAVEDEKILAQMENFFGEEVEVLPDKTVIAEEPEVPGGEEVVVVDAAAEVQSDTEEDIAPVEAVTTCDESADDTTRDTSAVVNCVEVSAGEDEGEIFDANTDGCEHSPGVDTCLSPLGFADLFAAGPAKRVGSALRARANGCGGATTRDALGLLHSPGGTTSHPPRPSPGAALRFVGLAQEQDESDAAEALAAEKRCEEGVHGAMASAVVDLTHATGLRRAFPRGLPPGTPGATRVRSQDTSTTQQVTKSSGGASPPLGSVAALTPVRATAVCAGAGDAEELVATPVRRSARRLRAAGAHSVGEGTALSAAGFNYAPNPNFTSSPAASPAKTVELSSAQGSGGPRRSSRLAGRDS